MTKESLKENLCRAGRELVEKKLVARTWGNFSVRLSVDTFLITPSGRTYEGLKPDEIVEINTKNSSYTGSIKPSSEKEMHRKIYNSDASVNAIVHTHQFWASAVSASQKSISAPYNIPCAPYALPTTTALAKSVHKIFTESKSKVILLSNHGAICMGGSIKEAIALAEKLEEDARSFVLTQYRDISGHPDGTENEMIDYYLNFYEISND